MTDRDEQVAAYVGFCQRCGAMRAAQVNDADSDRKEVAKFCSEVVRGGLRLESSTVGAVRKADWTCRHEVAGKCPERVKPRRRARVGGAADA